MYKEIFEYFNKEAALGNDTPFELVEFVTIEELNNIMQIEEATVGDIIKAASSFLHAAEGVVDINVDGATASSNSVVIDKFESATSKDGKKYYKIIVSE